MLKILLYRFGAGTGDYQVFAVIFWTFKPLTWRWLSKKQPVMESYDRDILLLGEMIASELFQFKKGSPDRDKFWESTQRRLNRLDNRLWTLPNIRFRWCLQDQILRANCAENLGSWNGSSSTKPRILHQKLFYHHMLVTASLLVHEKTFFTEVFASLQGTFRKGCRRKNTSLLKVGFWRERRRPLTQAGSFVDVAVAPKTSGA